jgi:hypothetical protein
VAIKRVVYWPFIVEPGSRRRVANKNPTLGDPANPAAPKILLYTHRDETNGLPDILYRRSRSHDLDRGDGQAVRRSGR